MHVLDNPVWHALDGPHRTVAEGGPYARRYQPHVAVFSAVPDDPTADAWDTLAALVGPGGFAMIIRGAFGIPPGWGEAFRFDGLQMVATGPVVAPPAAAGRQAGDVEIVALGDADVDAMVDLVERTQPGPFLPGTPALGRYAGVRHDGALVAMAGERLHPPGHVEVSAVCTDPAHRGRGLAAALVVDISAEIRARDEVPMLHVRSDNESAIRLYLAMGFTVRRRFDGVGLRVPAPVESWDVADR